jgi:hypothetical protein
MRYFAVIVTCLSLTLQTGCQDRLFESHKKSPLESKVAPMSYDVSIKIGEQGSAFAKRYPKKIRIAHQPAGIDFYNLDWDRAPRGRVTLDHGQYSFTVDDVLGLWAPQDLQDRSSEGLSEFHLNAGLTTADTISHKEALLQMYAMLRAFEKLGWKSITPRSRPRLRGKERLSHVLNVDSSIGLDASQTPNHEEWMQLENMTQWEFYADHLYLEVNFMRQSAGENSPNVGAYLIGFVIKSEAEYFRNHVKSEDRQRWKQVLPGVLAHLANLRAENEAKLRAKGIAIDESYQDPPVPDLK